MKTAEEIAEANREYMGRQYGAVIKDLERQRDALDRAIISLREMLPWIGDWDNEVGR